MRKSQWRKPYRVKRRIPIFKNRFFWQAIIALLFLIGFFYLICFSSIFQVRKIVITGEEKVSTQDIKDLVEKEVGSIFLAKPNKIEKMILNDFPQIAEIEIKRGFPDALDIIITERVGVATWCQEQDCFLFDNQGIIFQKMAENGLGPFLKIRGLERIEDVKLGKQVIEKEPLSQILEVETKIKKESKVDLEEVLIVSDKRLNFKTLEKWEIYFNLEKNIDWQITELSLVLEQEIPKEQRKNLEYIDLRFSKVYYKYKD
ncbi:FtsQ-type POTRA domain-containing protein [Candidatus Parcubacteria bacterium]|nr:FtsQ-type POTRA domain-containing protein [Candidatus Parcubacteria bacterium]